MIDQALSFLTNELNSYITLRSGTPDNTTAGKWVVLSNVATQEGNWAIPDNTIGLSLINIEEERVFKDQQTAFRNDDGKIEHYNPELKLNLYVLITANFTSGGTDAFLYEEGLKQLSYAISFFQGKNVFTTDNSPALDASIKKLIVEMYSYSFEQQYNFWTVIGAKYLPSALYRVRMLTIQERRTLDQGAPVSVTDTTLSNK